MRPVILNVFSAINKMREDDVMDFIEYFTDELLKKIKNADPVWIRNISVQLISSCSAGIEIKDVSTHNPNLLQLGIGRSTSGKTTPITKFARPVLTDVGLLTRPVTLPFDSSSIEAIISYCSQKHIFHALAVHDEFATILKQRSKKGHYLSDIDKFMNHVFDGTGYDRVTRPRGEVKHDVIAPNSYYSFISTMTKGELKLMDESWFSGGTGNRFLYTIITPSGRRKLSDLQIDPNFKLNVVPFLAALYSTRGTIVFSDGALSTYQSRFDVMEDTRNRFELIDPVYADYVARIGPEFIPKLAGIKALSELFTLNLVAQVGDDSEIVNESMKILATKKESLQKTDDDDSYFTKKKTEVLETYTEFPIWCAYLKKLIHNGTVIVEDSHVEWAFQKCLTYFEHFKNLILMTPAIGEANDDEIMSQRIIQAIGGGATTDGRIANRARIDQSNFNRLMAELVKTGKVLKVDILGKIHYTIP